jgi:hypothetical protein
MEKKNGSSERAVCGDRLGETRTGGGVNLSVNGTFTMKDGTITGNTASNGGGGAGRCYALQRQWSNRYRLGIDNKWGCPSRLRGMAFFLDKR